MKAEKTRHLINSMIDKINKEDNHLKNDSILNAHLEASNKELDELERLAIIGKATEKAFAYSPKHKHQYNVFSLGELHEESDFSFYSVQDLLNWAE